jgi:hypothetical protein
MSRFLLLFIVFITLVGKAQTDTKELDLNRFFLDISPTFGIDKPIKNETTSIFGGTVNSTDYGAGLELKTGNNWYLNKGKFCGILRFTWIRLGFLFSDGLFAFASPANLGIGHHFQLNDLISIEPMVHSGIVFVMDDIIQVDGFINYFVMPEIKLNIGNFALGIEYTLKRGFSSNGGSVVGHYHYFGLSFGGRFKSL